MRIRAVFACLALVASAQAGAAADSQLADGREFVFWEKPLTFSRTYYVDGSARGDDRNRGTIAKPFRTIGKAAEVLQPGERVVIASGTYREVVRPARGGSGPDAMISYEAAPGAIVIVKGSEILRDWKPGGDGTWKHALTGALFPDAYNPFALATVPGDWSWLDTKRVDMGPYFRRRGLIFADGKPLEPVEQHRELTGAPMTRSTALPSRSRGGPIMQEIGGSPDARFWVEHQGNVLHIRLPSGDPAQSLIEVTTREQAFAPLEAGLGYILIKGITFQHAGNAFPPPQRGLVSTGGGHHWILEGNTLEWASGVGLDIGNQYWGGGPRHPKSGHSHIVRGNTFRYLGVEGIGGMGTTDTLVEDNLIEWIGWQDAERAWEAAGAKFHRARNLLFRRNVVRHIRHANAVWLDVGNVNSRITHNVLADVLTVSAAIHMEMSLERNQIDNNIIWDVRNAEPGTPGQRGAAGSGIFLHASQNQLVTRNLIGRCDNAGVWPALRPDRAGSGNARQHSIHDNVFTRCDKGGIVFVDADNEADGNVYASLPERFGGVAAGDAIQWLNLADWQSRGWDRNGSVVALEMTFDADRLELGVDRSSTLPKAGPFASQTLSGIRSVDPRRR